MAMIRSCIRRITSISSLSLSLSLPSIASAKPIATARVPQQQYYDRPLSSVAEPKGASDLDGETKKKLSMKKPAMSAAALEAHRIRLLALNLARPSSSKPSAAATPSTPATPRAKSSAARKKAAPAKAAPLPSPAAPPLAKKNVPIGNGWKNALLVIARNPERYPTEVVDVDDITVTMKDGYDKAHHHWLVFPRRELHLNHVNELKAEHIPLLEHMVTRAHHVIAQRRANDATSYTYQLGFHAIPSMTLLHLHVISQDFNAEGLKHRKHWRSFTTPYFITVDYVIDQLRTHGSFTIDEATYQQLVDVPHLGCHRCSASFENMPSLKKHIITCNEPARPIDNAAFERTRVASANSAN